MINLLQRRFFFMYLNGNVVTMQQFESLQVNFINNNIQHFIQFSDNISPFTILFLIKNLCLEFAVLFHYFLLDNLTI